MRRQTYEPDEEPRGKVVWDDAFNLSDAAAQRAVLNLCDALQARSDWLLDCLLACLLD